MSKTKKIATAVVSIVLASTMCASLAACKDGDSNKIKYPTSTPEGGQYAVSVAEDGSKKLAYNSGTQLNMNMGQNDTYTISFRKGVIANGRAVTLPDGTKYVTDSLKPAWQTMATELDIKINDVFTAYDSAKQITQAVTDNKLKDYAMISGDSTSIVNEAASNGSFVDLSKYLDYMPNFKYFLENNEATLYSLTSSTDNGAIYYAPYYDGNDDIEKYVLANQHWITALLDSAAGKGDSTTFAAQAEAKDKNNADSTSRYASPSGTSASVESFMGKTGEWWIETTKSKTETTSDKTVKVVVSYDDALTAANDSGSALGKALTAAGVTVGSLKNGNIVDLQNEAINKTKGAVTGAQLLDILKAYIDVAYQTESGDKFYATRSDVFNGYNAAWDVDLLVALSRCIVTNVGQLDNASYVSKNVYAIGARQGNSQRQNDLVSLAGELYGVRGLTSRYEYTYINKDGKIDDARNNTEMWEKLDNMHDMVEEGLIYTGTNNKSGSTSYYVNEEQPVIAVIYDYNQTQTANGGFVLQGIKSNSNIKAGYNFAPIVTAVSKWNDGDTTDDGYDYDGNSKYMRFTESWRSVKNTGFAIPVANIKGNPDRLSAALAVIDYMFSNDGQIVMTYGQQSTAGNTAKKNTDGSYKATDNGWWYGEKQTNVKVEDVAIKVPGTDQYTVKDEYADKYFIYKNEVYTGTLFNEKLMQPTMTTANLMFYYGYKVNGIQLAEKGSTIESWGYACNYTNYARGVIGSAQPMGNKLQSFEAQCTAEIGIEGGNKVGASIKNGTISHVYIEINNEKNNMWYYIVPTTLPVTTSQANAINTTFNTLTQTLFANSSGNASNLPDDVIWYGLTGTEVDYKGTKVTIPTSARALIDNILENGNFGKFSNFEGYIVDAWTRLYKYYNKK